MGIEQIYPNMLNVFKYLLNIEQTYTCRVQRLRTVR
jgi:hypothetical protein